ncbi:MAG TPA: putative porin [Candidatus Binatia bacterium]|nr:putative porin [Candidatus Binatia bacterium]
MKSRALVAAGLAATLWANVGMAKDLGDILLQKGLITEEELKQAREEEKQKTAAEESRRDAIAAKLPKWLEAITPFGDIRVRDEGFYQQDLNARNRFRTRARIGLTITPSDELAGAVRLATGDSNDPISTNQTLGNTFSRKSINLDWAYLTLKPGKSLGIQPGWITITGGKFGVTSYRPSELVWDDDVSPEGASETVNLVDQRENFVRGLKLNIFQWVVDEIANASDPWMFGGQVVADTAFSERTKWTVAFADYHYEDLDSVAIKYLSPFSGTSDPYSTNASQNTSLANSNTVLLSAKDSKGNRKIIGYAEGFNIVNGSTELNFADPFGLGVPAGLFGDVAYNTLADSHNTGLYVGVGLGKAGKDWYRDTLKNQGDWSLSYTYAWVEKDAVLSIFSFSDINEFSTAPAKPGSSRPTQKGGTNLMAHIPRIDYVLLPNLQLTAKAYIENVLDRKISNAALTGNPTLVRMQLDAQLKF